MNHNRAALLLLIPMTAIAIVAIVSPAALVRNLGGPRKRRAPKIEIFLRVAGALILISDVIGLFYRV